MVAITSSIKGRAEAPAVALPDREKSQIFIQRYVERFPAAGEIIIFDRSWYNRASVEYVMGFTTKEAHRRFLARCPEIEKYIVDGGIIPIKMWLEVGQISSWSECMVRPCVARRHRRLGRECGRTAAINPVYANASSAARSPSGCEICLSSST